MSCSRGCCASFKEHVQGITFSAAATPTRRAATAAIDEKERQWSVDGDAYKRMRNQGLQPKDVDGSAALEKRANDELELKAGHTLGSHKVKLWKSATSEMQDKGLIPRAS